MVGTSDGQRRVGRPPAALAPCCPPPSILPSPCAVSSLPGLKDRGDGKGERSWAQLARQHAVQWAGLLALLLLLAASEKWHPVRRNLYVGETPDLELWRYSYPLKANTVPAWAVPCVSVTVPCALIVAWLLSGRISRAEAHAALLVCLYCVAATGTLTNWVKTEVGGQMTLGARTAALVGVPSCCAPGRGLTARMLPPRARRSAALARILSTAAGPAAPSPCSHPRASPSAPTAR